MSNEDDSGFELNRRRVLASIGTVGLASAGAGAGTMALFSDEEQSNNNTIAAGTLDLTVGGGSSATVDVDDLVPGGERSSTTSVRNKGDVDGNLRAYVTNVRAGNKGGSNVRTFTSAVASAATEDRTDALSDYGVDPVETSVDLGGDTVDVTVDLPVGLGESSDVDNVSITFDVDNDGTADFQIELVDDVYKYKVFDGGWSTEAKGAKVDDISGLAFSHGNGSVELTLASGFEHYPAAEFGLGGQVQYQYLYELTGQGPEVKTTAIPLTPGFSYDPTWQGDASRYTTIDPAHVRTLDDVAEVEFRAKGESLNRGKVSRIADDEGASVGLDQGRNTDVEVVTRLPANAGNGIAGEDLTFDIVFELVQRV